jgi:hypothetical protein
MLMTPEEQERYTQVFQDHYSHMYDWFCILSLWTINSELLFAKCVRLI